MAASIRAFLMVEYSMAAAGVGATVNTDLTSARPFDIVDAHCVPQATAGVSGTCAFQRQALGAGNFNAITNTMTATTASTVARTTTVTEAERTVSTTDVVRMAVVDGGGGGGARVRGYLHILPNVIS